MMAAREPKNIETLKFLLEIGAHPDARSDRNYSPLLIATRHSNTAGVKLILTAIKAYYNDNPSKQYEALTCQGHNGNTPLSNAKKYCNEETVGYIETAIAKAEKEKLASGIKKLVAASKRKPKAASKPESQEAQAVNTETLLASYGNSIHCGDLLKPCENEKTLLHNVIEGGQLGKLMGMLAAAGERLDKTILLACEPRTSENMLSVIAQQGQLPLIFTVENWTNNVRELQEVWSRVPKKHQKQMDGQDGNPSYRRILQATNAASIKSLQMHSRVVGE